MSTPATDSNPVPDSVCDRRLAIDELDRAIVNLAARINASTYDLLVLIREFDESPAGTGARDGSSVD